MEPIEKARGLWHFVQTMDLEDLSGPCNILRCQSRNRIHFCGFIADLLIKLELQEFSEALDSTLAEWRSRWNLRARELPFIERVGLFGELVVLCDLLKSGTVNDSSGWVARNEGDGLHDFVFESHIFETKSTVQDEGEIHIFHENQLHHRDGLILLLVKLDLSDTGESIDDLVRQILPLLDTDQSRQDFLDKIDLSGFMFGQYTDDRFQVRSKRYWRSEEDSPFIQLQDLDRNIRRPNNISYYVFESDIDFSDINDFSELAP